MAKGKYTAISTKDDEEKSSFASLLLFSWMNVIFKTGSERALEQHDFLPLSKANSTCLLSEQLQTSWNQERNICKTNGKKPSLWKSVVKMVSIKDVFIIAFTSVLFTVSRLLQPLFLGYLVSALMAAESQQRYLLYACALAMGVNAFVGSIGVHQFDYRCEVLAIRISSALKGLVYFKTLLLSRNSLLEFTTGRVIDLISNDVQRLEQEVVKLILVEFACLLELTAVSLLLTYFIGWQALMGVFLLCLLVPYFAGLSFVSAKLRVRTAVVSDQRISLMNQVVSGIRAIKRQAWEDGYREKISLARRHEINIIREKSTVLSGVAGLEYSSVPMATLVAVITLVLTGHTLTPMNVFMLLSFINRLRQCTCYYLAYGFLETYEAYASLRRIEEFLLSENLRGISNDLREDEDTDAERKYMKLWSDLTERPKKPKEADEVRHREKPTTLVVSGLTHRKRKREDEFILENIELTAATQSLTVVTGPVGSGKSTLLSAIGGEISNTSGKIAFQGTLVYVPQTAWVFSGTIRENILFGQPYDEPKYTKVLESCALTEDIQRFPEYDQTIVGERGEVLSGGQRARVSLARAVYSNADLYLLDDPLSAVDFKVGQHIFEKCITGLLSDKTRVLVSHQEQHMKDADEVVVLYRGRVLKKGSFAGLQEQGILNKTVDPLYKKVPEEENSKGFVWENETESDVADNHDRMARLPNESKGLQISEEDRAIGVVSFKLYWNYFRSGAQILMIFGIISLCLITQGKHSKVNTARFLLSFADISPLGILALAAFKSLTDSMIVSPDVWLSFLTRKSPDDQKDKTNLVIYGCLVGASFVFAILRAYGFLLVSLRCSERLHDKMVVAILQAPVLFFDSNPVGRILNRFSKDIGCVDELLPKTFLFSIQLVLLVIASILIPVVTNPWLLLVVAPTTVAVVYISKYYLRTARELKRLESICRSPVFSHLSETLNGLDTIRTRGRQRDFVDQFYRYQDVHNQSNIMVKASGRWLGVRLDVLASLLIGSVALAAVVMSQDAASAGLALVYAIQTVSQTQKATRKASDVENLMTSVERVMTYTKLESEPGYKVKRFPPDHWPSEGNITFQDVSLVYYSGGPQVLKRINLNIKAGAKVGVAGRTGAGKSSFVAALMRMPDAEGEIVVDGVRIKEINLQEARRCISVLGQSPVLFSGSLRKNLDLAEQFQDVDLWRALEDVQLKELVEGFEGQLDHELLEHGANVSVGERQLVCLARVLLQRSKIVILDEPTSHVDPETEKTIWSVVREKLKDSTVITIAHRLNTIKDCDMILVLKNGEVDKFDGVDSLMNIKD